MLHEHPRVLRVSLTLEGQPYELISVVEIVTDLPLHMSEDGYDADALDELIHLAADFMKTNPNVSTSRFISERRNA